MIGKHFDLTKSRVCAFLNRDDMIKAKQYISKHPFTRVLKHKKVFTAPVSFQEATSDPTQFEEVDPTNIVGTELKPIWSTHWFRFELDSIPDDHNPAENELHLLWASNGEALLYSSDGVPLNSFTGVPGEKQRDSHPIIATNAGTPLVFYLEAVCSGIDGNTTSWPCGPDAPNPERPYKITQCGVGVLDKMAHKLLCDLSVLYDLSCHLPNGTQSAHACLDAADRAINALRVEDRSTYARAQEITGACFAELGRCADTSPLTHRIFAVGNCHIDTAWLWPYCETRRKCCRSWVAQLRIAEQCPGYTFAISQAQQLKWLKQDYPDVFAQVKAAVVSGCGDDNRSKFSIVGSTWVEMDCNIPSGESLVRQFLYDTFGYSVQIPQIMKLCEVPYFLTQKLSWNQFNKFPYTSFVWEGLDGSQVLTHFPPAETYCGNTGVDQLIKTEDNNHDKDRCNSSIMLYGHGDGGGGPQKMMVERLERLSCIPALPIIKMKTPEEFFLELEKCRDKLLTWKGELYLELHRGTYTTQAHNKLNNRRAEVLLRNIEFAASIAQVLGCEGYAYPSSDIDHLWELVLLNQFHDVIPGSSIGMVYKDSAQHYAEIFDLGGKLLKAATEALARRALGAGIEDASAVMVVANTAEWERLEVVELPPELCGSPDQMSADGKALCAVLSPSASVAKLEDCRGKGRDVMEKGPKATATCTPDGKYVVLENRHIRATLRTDSGELTSLVHKDTGREVIAPGAAGNRFVLFEDAPNYWDAWDVDIFHLEKPLDVSNRARCRCDVVEEGPARASVRFQHELTDKCRITQTVRLGVFSRRLDFVNHVDWHESRKILKTEFAFNLRSLYATYETQFGHIERPTHTNTSWDMAKFEVCGHRWADLSEYGFGVSLLNDSKYGYSTLGSTMRLSLLRAPKLPDPDADMGEHDFTFSVFPHSGCFQSAGTIREGANLNMPLLAFPAKCGLACGAECGLGPLLEVSCAECAGCGAVIESVKLDEDTRSSLVVRVCERFGGRSTYALTFSGRKAKSAEIVNLLEHKVEDAHLEEKEEECACNKTKVLFSLKPFEIKTIKLNFN